MTYKDKLSVIGEKLTTDKTLADLMVRLQMNQREDAMLKMRNYMSEIESIMRLAAKQSDISSLKSEIGEAVSLFNIVMAMSAKIQANDTLIEMLYDCIGEKEKETK